MSKPEMVFVFPYFDDVYTGFVNSFTYSLGTGYIRAYLAEHGISSAQYIQYEPRTVKQTAEEIIALGSDIVGFSCVDVSFYFGRIIAAAIKAMKPDTTIIFGGPAVTLADDIVMRESECIDICCRGESEETCYELLLKLKNNESIADIHGITYRSNGSVVRTPDRPLLRKGKREEELDFLPSPYLTDMIPIGWAPEDDIYKMALLTARGCTHKCTYCTNTTLGRNRIRFHSVDRVINEIKHISRYYKTNQAIVFFDDAFTLDVERAKRICRRIIDESLNYMRFECATRIDKFDQELLELFNKSGFTSVAIGLESGSPRILNKIKKVRSMPAVNGDYGPELRFLESMRNNIGLCNRLGLTTGLSIILGLPGETPEEARETMRFLEEVKPRYYMHNYLIPIYGTEVFNNAHLHGIEVKSSPFLLPYLTDYSYDVYAIKPLKQSTVHLLLEHRNKWAVEILKSFFSGFNPRIEEFFPGKYLDKCKPGTAIFITSPLPLKEINVFSWLSTIVQFTSDVFITEKTWDFDTRTARHQAFAAAQIPLINYRMVSGKQEERISADGGKTVIDTYTLRNWSKTIFSTAKYSYPDGNDYRYHILPFCCDYNLPVDPDNEIKFKSIDSKEDLDKMLGQWPAHDGTITLTREELQELDYDILDKCRWSARPCEACSLKKLIIGKDHDVFTCYSGHPVAKAGIDFNRLKEKLETLQKETQKHRGCRECPVRDRCAKCMFIPSFLSESRYCRLMKENQDITMLMEIFSFVRELRIQKRDLIDGAERIAISRPDHRIIRNNTVIPDDGLGTFHRLLKVTMDDRQYLLYNPENKAFSTLSRTMSEIWDRWAAGGEDRETLCKRLAEERNLSYDAISNAFDMLLNKTDALMKQTKI
jgi:radical SAM superfamily enzyme YgiQ (UPF0313 family)